MNAEEIARYKAKNLRWKRPLVKDLNLESIRSELYDMNDECENVRWAVDQEGDDNLAELLGDEEDAYQFKMQFSDLEASIEKMRSDLDEIGYYGDVTGEDVDCLLVAANGAQVGGGLIGYDTYEEDYYGLESIYNQGCADDAEKKITRLKKSDLINLMEISLHLAVGYTSIKFRYDCLKAAMDIVAGKQAELVEGINEICKQYEECEKANWHDWKLTKRFDATAHALPDQVWIQ